MDRKKWPPFILMLLQNLQPLVPRTGFDNHPPHSSPYFTVTTSLHNLFSSNPNLHGHFPNKDWLKVVSFWIPNPHKPKECIPYPIPPSGAWSYWLQIEFYKLGHYNKCHLFIYASSSWCPFNQLNELAYGNFTRLKSINDNGGKYQILALLHLEMKLITNKFSKVVIIHTCRAENFVLRHHPEIYEKKIHHQMC